jgi:O-antigen ligase
VSTEPRSRGLTYAVTVTQSTVLQIFVFSGMLKWLPWPIDPTLLFGSILAAMCLWRVVAGNPAIHGRVLPLAVANLLFLGYYASTALFTVSPAYWQTKLAVLALSALALLAPLVLFEDRSALRANRLIIEILAVIGAGAVIWAYQTGVILVISEGLGRQESKLPDYLTLGYLIGLGILSTLGQSGFWAIGVRLPCIAALLLLPGRGPFLLTLSGVLVVWLIGRRAMRIGRRQYIAAAAYGALLFGGLLFWEGGTSLRLRLTGTVDSAARRIENSREEEFTLAASYINESMPWGSGVGGYGLAVHDKDENIYPHNLVLESFAEGGLVGGALFTGAMIAALFASLKLARHTGRVVMFVLLGFTLANYMKSGGFVGTRDLYMFVGLVLVELSIGYADQDARSVPIVDEHRAMHPG